MENVSNKNIQTFEGLGIRPDFLLQLEKSQFTVPTPIQYKAIPAALEGKDVVGIAQTGTGKTLAFGIPMIQRIAVAGGRSRGLILLPTRELALQVNETFQKITKGFGMRTAVLIGGDSMQRQLRALRENPHIIIGTPGRIVDHLQQKTLRLDSVSILVLDEADSMFDMGFAQQIRQIMAVVPKDRQTLLFSATMPDPIMKIASTHMKLPLRIEIVRPGTAAEKVEHELFFIQKEQRMALLQKLLNQYTGSVLVFSRTKHGAKKICKNLVSMRFSAEEIHSNRSLAQRKKALDGFKTGRYRILVATDIASRGIDVKGIALVINYDLPESAEDYVHRIGRTARAGLSGKAISFALPEQRGKVREIEQLIRSQIPVSQMEGIAAAPLKQTQKISPHSQHRQKTYFKKDFSRQRHYRQR